MSDIIVIGGGVAGLSAAAALSQEARVTVLEQEGSTGYHASGRSAAMFEENYGAPSVQALSRASAPYHREANGGYLSPRGFMIVATKEERAAFDMDSEALGAAPISLAQAQTLVPILEPKTVAFAGYHEGAMDIDTDRLMQDFSREVRRNGGQIITKARVTKLSRTSTGWQVQVGALEYACETLVNAAGAWADQIARLAQITPINLMPCRRSMARIPAPEDRNTRDWPMFFGVGETWYAKPDAGALLISPADEEPVAPQDAWADDMVLAEGIARYQAMVRPRVTHVSTSWAGLRSFAPDRTLVLGPDPSDTRFIWCAGQGGYGFQTAPAAGALVADLVMRRTPALPPDIVAALKPDRLRA